MDPRDRVGLDSFGEVSVDPSGRLQNDAETVRQMIEEGSARRSGGSIVNSGEHYRQGMVD